MAGNSRGPYADPGSFLGFAISIMLPGGVIIEGTLQGVEGDVLEMVGACVHGPTGQLWQDKMEVSRKHVMGIGRDVPQGR
jgi:hypothetical protein